MTKRVLYGAILVGIAFCLSITTRVYAGDWHRQHHHRQHHHRQHHHHHDRHHHPGLRFGITFGIPAWQQYAYYPHGHPWHVHGPQCPVVIEQHAYPYYTPSAPTLHVPAYRYYTPAR